MQVNKTDKPHHELPSLSTKHIICHCHKIEPTDDITCSSGICKTVKVQSVSVYAWDLSGSQNRNGTVLAAAKS